MNKSSSTVIRLSITSDVRQALSIAKKRYPALSDPEILKLGLSQITVGYDDTVSSGESRQHIRRGAAYSVGQDYLEDPAEDEYTTNSGKQVHFS